MIEVFNIFDWVSVHFVLVSAARDKSEMRSESHFIISFSIRRTKNVHSYSFRFRKFDENWKLET